MTDKRKLTAFWGEATLQKLEEEALRLDRSLSWLTMQAWSLQRERALRLEPASPEVEAIKERSPSRHPLRATVLQANLKLLMSQHPSAGLPKGLALQVLYIPTETMNLLDELGERLGLATWELLEWALEASWTELARLPTVNDPPVR